VCSQEDGEGVLRFNAVSESAGHWSKANINTMKTLTSIPASLFGMPVGIMGLAGAWTVGARIWNLPAGIAAGIAIAGALVWAVLIVLYANKWLHNRVAAVVEARDPVQSSFVSLLLISSMLVSISALEVSRPAGLALFSVCLAAQLVLGVWLMGRIWQGGQGSDFVTPALYLPTVGQNFVAANVAAIVHWPQVGHWLFGCGVISWFAIESVVLARVGTRDTMPIALRPTIGVQLAPPVVGGLAYLSLTTGAPDFAAQMLFGYGLFQAALLLRLASWIQQPSFSPGYWSFSFGATALPTMAMRMIERGSAGPMSWVAPVLFVAANIFIVYLTVSCLRLLMQGRLLEAPAGPALQAALLSPHKNLP
jgi:tellurite resistance protein